MGERYLAGPRDGAAADKARHGDGVVGTAERPVPEDALSLEEAGHAVDLRHLEGLLIGHGREDGGDATRQHGLAGAGRAGHEQIVGARRGDLEGALGDELALHVGQIVGLLRREVGSFRTAGTSGVRPSSPSTSSASVRGP